jgi:hypothetical protein
MKKKHICRQWLGIYFLSCTRNMIIPGLCSNRRMSYYLYYSVCAGRKLLCLFPVHMIFSYFSELKDTIFVSLRGNLIIHAKKKEKWDHLRVHVYINIFTFPLLFQ